MMRLTVAACAATLSLLAAPALAQTSPAKPAAAKPAAKSAAKPAAKKAPAKQPAAPAEPPVQVAPADEAQLAAAERVYLGQYDCELRKTLSVAPSTEHAGYMTVSYASQQFLVKPVLSSTGAVRLEDVRGRGLMVQIAQKSMLLDMRQGVRLADECVSTQQAENRRVVAQAATEAAAAASAAQAAATAAATAASAAVAAAQAASAAAAITAPASAVAASPASSAAH